MMEKNPRAKRRTDVAQVFKRYLPEAFVEMVVDLFLTSAVRFKIVNGRATKLGDFRAGSKGEKHRITVNGDLNPYSFLITTLHEFAHLNTYEKYRNKVLPHGEEWKASYRTLLIPVIQSGHLPKDIENALVHSLSNTKASSCSDYGLSRVLKSYDRPKEGVVLLEQLPKNTTFELNGRQFIKGSLRRKRFVCQEVYSDRSFLVNALAEVRPIK
jgi:SprT protein